jgi:hypothetical protein
VCGRVTQSETRCDCVGQGCTADYPFVDYTHAAVMLAAQWWGLSGLQVAASPNAHARFRLRILTFPFSVTGVNAMDLFQMLVPGAWMHVRAQLKLAAMNLMKPSTMCRLHACPCRVAANAAVHAVCGISVVCASCGVKLTEPIRITNRRAQHALRESNRNASIHQETSCGQCIRHAHATSCLSPVCSKTAAHAAARQPVRVSHLRLSAMVCPLRFVVAGISALIVLFIAADFLWFSKARDDDDDGYHAEGEQQGHVRFRSTPRLMLPCPTVWPVPGVCSILSIPFGARAAL